MLSREELLQDYAAAVRNKAMWDSAVKGQRQELLECGIDEESIKAVEDQIKRQLETFNFDA